MTDIFTLARSARELLSQALNCLQADPSVPKEYVDMALPIAQGMGALHQIEKFRGDVKLGNDVATKCAETASTSIRTAMIGLQSSSLVHPSVGAALEATAKSMNVLFQLKQSLVSTSTQGSALPATPRSESYVATMQGALPVGGRSPVQSAAPEVIPHEPTPPAPPPAAPPPQPTPPAAEAVPHAAPQQALRSRPPATEVRKQGTVSMGPTHKKNATMALASPLGEIAKSPVKFPPLTGSSQGPSLPTRSISHIVEDPFASRNAGKDLKTEQPSSSMARSQNAVSADLGTHSPSNFYKGLSGNDVIDHGGIFVSTYTIPKIGTKVKIRIALPGGYEFEASGVVEWTREASISSDVPPGFGAKLHVISQEARQLVYRYVRNREPLFYDDL